MNIHIRTTNAAFEGRTAAECARILREIADKLDGATWSVPKRGTEYPLYDVNGKKVGKVRP